jgi:hypothetical protein
MELRLSQLPLKPAAVPRVSQRFGQVAWPAVPALMVSLAASAICYWQTSATLGLFLGPLILTTLIIPPLIVGESGWLACLSVLLGVVIGPSIIWLTVANTKVVDGHQVFLCAMVLAAWLSVVSGGALLLRAARVVASLAVTVTVIVSCVWLTWPIWLSPLLASHERAVAWLSWAHPVMAMNSVVRHLGLWGSPMGGSDLAYKYLTILNQDVAYPQSQSIWPCVLIYSLAGITLVSSSLLITRLRSRSNVIRNRVCQDTI